VPLKPLILNKLLFHEKHRNFPRKIVPTMRLSPGKICTISAGKAGIFEVTENFCGSAGYWNATLQFSRFPTATFGTENETTRKRREREKNGGSADHGQSDIGALSGRIFQGLGGD